MLGSQVELWESMLALIRLGAVIVPTTTAAGPVELADRFDRGGARAVVCNAAGAAKFDDVPGDYVRVAVGPRRAPSWWSTLISPIPWATCPRCTGLASNPATCTSTFPAPAGRSTLGRTSSHRGWQRPPCLSTTTRVSTQQLC